jgi:valyl-tRNA synthetase
MAKSGSKSYDPAATEKRIFDFWEKGGYFHPTPDERGRDQRFCIMIPLPNVTAALHLGHALNNTLQDLLIRHQRMTGCNTLWMLGTDHAGIATQATVEKAILENEGKNRHDLGRDEMVRRIWEWKEKFGGRIIEQLKLMGCSGDYQRERFTLDEGCAKAVRHTFFKLFKDGLIYRGKRLVNWDTQLHTAVADDEVYHETVKGHFWHFKYPIIDPQPGEPEFVQIATTRPETMLGDTAVAVHPEPAAELDRVEAELKEKLAKASEKDRPDVQAALDDLTERRKTLLPLLLKLRDMANDGRMVNLPLMNRPIPLICDEWAKPELGSGCVKITPAHDPNDYEVYERWHRSPGRTIDQLLDWPSPINVMTEDGHVARIVEPDGSVNPNSEKYEGLKFATKGRAKVVADLEALGLVEKIEDHVVEIGHSDRSKTPIEPYLSEQWFVKMGDLTEEEAARVQTPFLKAYIEQSRSEPRPSGSGAPPAQQAVESRHLPGLAQMAMDAVKDGRVHFHPPRYEKTYLDWLSEKRDWCISRQLWWGHRIPVWSGQVEARNDTVESALAASSVLEVIKSQDPGIAATIRVVECRLDDDTDDHDVSVHDATIEKASNGRLFMVFDGKLYDLESEGEEPFEGIIEISMPVSRPDDQKRLEAGGFTQDLDVLDTWFSSALWPHSTLGWPDADPKDESNLLGYFYPTSVLSTAREIITLWVARMVMTGLYNIGDIPFRDVVIHPLIMDGQGRKMSKSLGNGVDPQDLIDEYGADALRFTLADLATETQDIRMPVVPKKLADGRTINISEKFEKGRNFCNKLWQASTGFLMRNLEGYAPRPLEVAALPLEDRWILSRMTACLEDLDRALGGYRFSEAMAVLYRFMWNEYCDRYIEMCKPRLAGERRAEAQQVLAYVLDRLLRMLHPFIPFITEEIWRKLGEAAPQRGLGAIGPAEPALVAAAWPEVDAALRDEQVESQMASLQAIIRGVREIRTVVNDFRGKKKQPSMRTLPSVTVRADDATCRLVETYRALVMPLAGCDSLEAGSQAAKRKGALSRVEGNIQVYVPVEDLVDLAEVKRAEQAKLGELAAAQERVKKQLANEAFVQRADPAVVARARQRAADLSSQIRLVEQHLADMG